jgi:periplasmic protein TonB
MRPDLSSASKRRFRTSRAAALAGIIVLHVAVVAVTLVARGPAADTDVVPAPIQVMVFNEPEQARPPAVPVQAPQIELPQVVMPIIQFEVPAPPPSIAVAAPAPTPAQSPALPTPSPPASTSVGDADSPVAIAKAEWVRMPSPAYPAAAKRSRAEGVVLVRALVDATGHAIKTSVHRTSGFAALDRAACDSVLAALFRPYLHNGVPRSVDVIVPITFALKGRGDRDRRDLQLDVRSQDHHAVRGHAEELGGLSAAALHVGE